MKVEEKKKEEKGVQMFTTKCSPAPENKDMETFGQI